MEVAEAFEMPMVGAEGIAFAEDMAEAGPEILLPATDLYAITL